MKPGPIFARRERWGLTWFGRFLILALLIICTGLWMIMVNPFLAVTQRIETDTLVVEGWIHDHAIRAAAEEFRLGGYQRVLVTGGPVPGTGGYINDFNTNASVGAERLKGQGLSPEVVQMVPSRVSSRDRTLGSARALGEWMKKHAPQVRRINVLTEDVHARRTWLLFRRALGREISVGIISIRNPDYDPRRWWRYSEGVKETMSETLAYIYASLWFSAE